jgi:multiple sugar transport system substrate-binding protein
MKPGLTRRQLLAGTGAAAAGVAIKGFPHIKAQNTKISIGVGEWAVESTTTLLQELDFTGKTGIEVEVKTRPRTPDEFTTQMAGAIQAGNTPYDVIDYEDEIASIFPKAGWLKPLDDLLTPEVWNDFPQSMKDMAEQWNKFEGATYRIHHNYEAQYYFYRKDVFDEKAIEAPKTWDDIRALGPALTDEAEGVYASGDGLAKGAFLNVFLAYTTLQAGGNPFDVDDKYKIALQFINDLMYTDKSFNPASLQKDYDQINQDYVGDRIFAMRQWPFFYDVARAATDWYEDGKAEIVLPPQGPGGKENSTYAAGWGFGIPSATKNEEAAKQLVAFLIDPANTGAMATNNTWWLNARPSCLEAMGDQGMAKYLKMYVDAGVIGVRPYHEKFREAVAVFEDAASAYLSKQISIDEALEQTKTGLEDL